MHEQPPSNYQVTFSTFLFPVAAHAAMCRGFLVLAISVASGSISYGQTPALLLFGGSDHKTFLGCLNCSKYDSGSVCNKYGANGSKYNTDSIWNPYGNFGSKYSSDSSWNLYSSSGPVIVDNSGQFYGRLSANKYLSDRTQIKALNQLVDIVTSGADLEAARNLFCDE
jgi:hypothetical protein